MVKVLFDHNMPPSIARALNELVTIEGHEAHALREKFPENTSDIDYFNKLGRDWIVVSKDLQNSRKKSGTGSYPSQQDSSVLSLSQSAKKENRRTSSSHTLALG
ncbi:hypothetical protein [Maritimibacter sp. 55A14]|uniref:PIN-like domain-containing protein n=1 Tax=Maritimibacter sp. 55A14 TaxID=2174844 RepID=UPI0011B20D7B|nr:hypothetical protein [Maritimibacter sp. 55A14]